jgi:hypothetical protein
LVHDGQQAYQIELLPSQINAQTKVANKMIIHILKMYNSRHPHTWEESLPYFQYSYNKALQTSINHNPFQACLGFQQLAPIVVASPIALVQEESLYARNEANKAMKVVKWTQLI